MSILGFSFNYNILLYFYIYEEMKNKLVLMIIMEIISILRENN